MPDELAPLVSVHVHHAFRRGGPPCDPLLFRPGYPVLWVMLSGALVVEAEGDTWTVTPGTALLWPRRRPRLVGRPMESEWLRVSMDATLGGAVRLFDLFGLPILWEPSRDDWPLLRSLAEAMVGSYGQSGLAPSMMLDGLGRALFALCWRMIGPPNLLVTGQAGDPATRLPSQVVRALQAIGQDPRISIGRLAAQSACSEGHLRRLFCRWMGIPPQGFLQRYRLERARQLLERTALPVSAIADHAGFDSHSHLDHAFRQAYGLSPSDYRRSVPGARSPSGS